MNRPRCFALFLVAALLTGCDTHISMRPMHDPIYPGANENVTFSLQDVWAGSGIKVIKLFVTETPVTAGGPGAPGTAQLIDSHAPKGQPKAVKSHTFTAKAFSANRLVKYRFEVTDSKGNIRSHTVDFATRPFPMPDTPAPVYAQGENGKVLNFVFIPDDGLTTVAQTKAFRTECRKMVLEIIDEPSLAVFNRQFNFYINPKPGNATSWKSKTPHGKPTNFSQISFAEAKVIVHDDKSLVNHATRIDGMTSATIGIPGSLRHEAGHSVFDLADEYDGDGGYWPTPFLPNVWPTKSQAKSAAPGRGKTSSDVQEIKTSSKSWWRICDNVCQMRDGYALKAYDSPCAQRLIYVVVDKASPGLFKP